MSSEIRKSGIDPEAELIVDFVNTLDLETGADAIAEPAALADWAEANVAGLGAPAVDASAQRRVLALRESLRALMRANNGGELEPGQLDALAEASERSRYRATLSDGRLAIEPAGTGLEPLEARLLLAVERLQAGGAWPRLKACPAGDCEWAFFDTSRNHSRTWCSMEECGNRAKTRRYRSRRR
ncbi:MAG: CGNR zinc finger domain-containing protein [Solirubrobacterales bacterium]